MGNTPIIIIGGSINLFLSITRRGKVPMPTLTGKIAVISGGTTGIGLAIAQRQAHLDEAARLIGQRYDHSGRRLEWG